MKYKKKIKGMLYFSELKVNKLFKIINGSLNIDTAAQVKKKIC